MSTGSEGEEWYFYEEWSGGVPEKILRLLVTCPYCGHKEEVELAESWYTMNMSVTCSKCGASFPVKDYSQILPPKKKKK
ncbi:MAG: hypothetical protein DRJ40_03555 [Thermoprotei archaeon]|nr:MAG: hypothetical protein DRJ40_03555 [Thermoprotei archaeon]